MGVSDSAWPPRPASVPADARWDPKDPGFEWVLGALDEAGRRHGRYRSWTREGVLHGECSYEHGVVHGTNINFHPDGTVASEATWAHGVIMDSAFFRSDAPSPEPFAQAAEDVWCVRYCTRDGVTNYTIRYFRRDGSECGPDGNALPARPSQVSSDARWFPDLERWVDGAIERGTNAQIGHWRWWSRTGVLRHEEHRDRQGRATRIVQYSASGALERRTRRDAQGEERERYFDNEGLAQRTRTDASGREVYRGRWSRDGELEEERVREYDRPGDTPSSVTERGEGGRLELEARREGPSLALVLYHEDGATIAATGLWRDRRLAGTWRLYDGNGTLHRELDLDPLGLAHGLTGQGLRHRLGHALYLTDEPTLATPDQLAGVDREPWTTTTGCYDRAVVAFPRLLRALVAPDAMVRSYALGVIVGEVEHQGTTYPATAAVIPYLARLVSHPLADRGVLLSTIHYLGQAAAPYVEQVRGLPAADPSRVAVEGTFHAVASAWPTIFGYFPSATAEERRLILVLAKFAPEARPSIVEVARNDADPMMRACAVESLAALPGFDVTDALPCLNDGDLLVRTATAVAIGLQLRGASPPAVVDRLREAVHAGGDLAARFEQLPYIDGRLVDYLVLAAEAIGTRDARRVAELAAADPAGSEA